MSAREAAWKIGDIPFEVNSNQYRHSHHLDMCNHSIDSMSIIAVVAISIRLPISGLRSF